MNAGLLIIALCVATPDETLAQAGRLADQAQDLFYKELPIGSSGLVTRFGLPMDSQRERARRVGREMNDLAARAESALEQAVLDAESGRGDLDTTLLHTERNRRVPFLRGIGACLDADFNVENEAGRKALYAVARSRLEPLADLLPDRFAVTARLYAGLARLGAGEPDNASRLLSDVAGDPQAQPVEVFAARMGLARCGDDPLAALDEIARHYGGAGDTPYRVLIADERFRLLRPVSPERAFAAYLDLGEAGFSRLERVAGPGTPLEQLPLLVSVARAGNLVLTPGKRAAGIELYERLLGSGGLDETAAAAALFGLARAHLADGDRVAATRRLAQLAASYPASSRAEQSVELAAAIAAELNRTNPADPVYRELLGEVLGLLLGRYPNLGSVDRWRYRAGCLAVDEGRFADAVDLFDAVAADADTRPDAMARRADALRAWMNAAPDTPTRKLLARRLLDAAAPALYRSEALLMLDEPAGALAALPDGDGDDEFTILVRIEAYRALGRHDEMASQLERLVDITGPRAGAALAAMLRTRMRDDPASLEPLAHAAMRWLDIHGDGETLRLITADALRTAGEHEDALRLYDELRADHPDTLEVLFGRAECLYQLGTRDEEAMDHYRRLVAATAADLDDHYWQSQLRMLQILSRTGRNTHRIAPYVQQLRGKDPELGGERYRREFERLLK